MFLDFVKIKIKAGDGGNGAVSFRREKYVAKGGPDGGDGGKGGDIIFVGKKGLSTLYDFKLKRHFFAPKGGSGGPKKCTGRNAEDLVIKVPIGTVVRDAKTNGVICDVFTDDEPFTVLTGGRGGKGNAHFRTAKRKTPNFSQLGEKVEQFEVFLELKTIADVGLVGFPNVGKSTLLSVLTSAKPKIANYHFTTLSPNLGIVSAYEDSFCIADIPGLIDGASTGTGLGHQFLRHIERVRLIVHLVDISGSEGRDAVDDFECINRELELYSDILSKKPQIVCASKIDLLTEESAISNFEKKIGKKVYAVSSITHQGIEELLAVITSTLKELPQTPRFDVEDTVSIDVKPDHRFEVIPLENNTFVVEGGLVDYLVQTVSLDSLDSLAFFQKIIKERGVITALKRAGMVEGDTVIIGDVEFIYRE